MEFVGPVVVHNPAWAAPAAPTHVVTVTTELVIGALGSLRSRLLTTLTVHEIPCPPPLAKASHWLIASAEAEVGWMPSASIATSATSDAAANSPRCVG